MTDPCDSPGACRGTRTTGGGRSSFRYDCDLPSPITYGLQTYNIIIDSADPIGELNTYNVILNGGIAANGGTGGVRFGLDQIANVIFEVVIVDNPNAYEAFIDSAVNALIISTKSGFAPNSVKAGVTWRIGSSITGFTSCLLLLTNICESTINIPLASSGVFTFICPNLPNPRQFGFFWL